MAVGRIIGMEKIIIREAAEHNLKSIDVEIPHRCFTVVTGVSGSGKSSLVFDTLYREGERRYLESFSSYARQFLGKFSPPAVGHIYGLSAAISIDQKTVANNPRSTVGTITELYDYLRLLFARLGKIDQSFLKLTGKADGTGSPDEGTRKIPPLERRLFSFNSPYGACPVCKGLGVEDRIDVDLIVADPGKTLRQGALKITTPSGYIIYSQVTMDVLNQVCGAHGFSVDIPWQELNEEQRKVILYGSDRIKIPFGKHPLESRLKWSGITAKPREEDYYKGIIPVMSNILKTKRNKNILRFARTMPCETCGGTRLKPEALAVRFKELNIAQMAKMAIDHLDDFFHGVKYSEEEIPVGEPLREVILQRTAMLSDLGLGYLTLDRESTTLSNGESRRLRLSTLVGSGLRGITYILDEPSVGLHQKDNRKLLDLLRHLCNIGNTVIVVEHDEEIMRCADWLIDIGPGPGIHGGEVLFSGPPQELLKPEALETGPLLKKSKTQAFLTGREMIPVFEPKRKGDKKFLKILGAEEHNLKKIDVPFKLRVLNVVSGVSGAGKSTLVHDILSNQLNKNLHNAVSTPGKHEKIEGLEYIDKVIEMDQTSIGRTPRSNPATYTGLFDHIRDLFSTLPECRARGWDKGRFSFNVKGGRCEACEGAGVQQIGMHFMGNVDVRCDVCDGKRFNPETLKVSYKGKNIYDILEMPIEEAAGFFKNHPKVSRYLRSLLDLGLGYVTLGQPATTLSGGEAQRIKLASELSRPSTGNTLYILDEPTTGLHRADIKVLLASLNRLVDKGNTVIAVEHHTDFIKNADWIIQLGPGSGETGGELVSVGGGIPAPGLRRPGGSFEKPPPGPPQNFLLGEHAVKSEVKPEQMLFGDGTVNMPIELKGVSTHNLKNIDVQIPVNRMTVITGVSLESMASWKRAPS